MSLVPRLLLAVAALQSCIAVQEQTITPGSTCKGTFFATFNIQNFGVTKASRSAILHALAQIIARYDIVAIQELSQLPSGSGSCGPNTMSAICGLLAEVRAVSSRAFSVRASPRIGDEQYAIFFDSTSVLFQESATYPDTGNIHSRPPHAFKFNTKSKDLVIGVTHTTPTKATAEIQNFPNIMGWMKTELGGDIRMLVGDYNADGSYFNEATAWAPVLAQMPGYSLLTGNELDTTVAAGSNTYDRILASSGLQADKAEVFIIERHVDLSQVYKQGCSDGYVPSTLCGSAVINWAEITQKLSDHYPLEMCLHLTPASLGARGTVGPFAVAPLLLTVLYSYY